MTHVILLTRYTRGHHPITNHKQYGFTIECSCGWRTRCNEGRREATRRGRTHMESAAAPGEGDAT